MAEIYTGAQYKALVPKYWFFKKYKEDGDEEFYTLAFNRDVTGVLKPYEVFLDLQEIAGDRTLCLLCYEKPCDFCHRHLVAEWLQKTLNIKVEEFEG